MEKVQIRVLGNGQDLQYSVDPDIAANIVQQLNNKVFHLPTVPTSTQGASFMNVSPKYRELAKYLHSRRNESEIRLTFSQIEQILGEPLRPSARKHKAWWANTTSHVQATAWLEMGRQAQAIDLQGETIKFTNK